MAGATVRWPEPFTSVQASPLRPLRPLNPLLPLNMALTPQDIVDLSRLLDQALALPAAEPEVHEAWLAGLPPGQQAHAARLRAMLALHRSSGQTGAHGGHSGSSGALQQLPRLGPEAPVAEHGERVGPYRLLREIGQGGMGSVWLAERADGAFQRQVALKLPRLSGSAGLAERMAREREIGALLEHPHIARLYDAGLDERGRPYIAMEYVDGLALDVYCRQQRLDTRERLRLFVQVVRAVAHAHGRLVIHRDIKPSNVIVSAQGQAWLLDFGIAKLQGSGPADTGVTQEYGRAMTPAYASPEQVSGGALGVAADIYSLGAMLYELLTGSLPHRPQRNSAAALEEAILQDEPGPASARASQAATARALRGEVDAILAQCLRREPERRYGTAAALADDIERHLSGQAVSAQPDTPWYRISKVLRRHRLAFSAGGAVLLALAGGGAVAMVQAQRAQVQAERARTVQAFVVDLFRANTGGGAAGAGLRQLPAEMLLERGARLIDTRFAGQPRLQADLHGVVAGVLLDMGSPSRALQHAQRHVQALQEAQAPQAEQLRGDTLLVELHYRTGKFAQAEAGARAALARDDGSDANTTLEARRWLALALYSQGRMADGDQALAAVEAQLGVGPATPSAARAEARWARAQRLAYANRFDEALPLYREAIATAAIAEGAQSPRVVRMQLRHADILLSYGRAQAARELADVAISSLRLQGGVAEIRAAVEDSAFYSMLYLNGHVPYAQALATVQRAQQALQNEGGLLPAALRAEVQFRLGWMNSRWGNVHEARQQLAQSVPLLQQDAALAAQLEPWLLWATGHAAMYAGDHTEATRQFEQHLAFRRRIGMSSHPWTAWTYANLAQNLAMQGRAVQALALIESAPAFDAPSPGSVHGGTPVNDLRITQAQLLLEQGDAQRALALLPPDGTDADQDAALADRRLLRGRVWCALGQPAQGLALQLQRINTLATQHYTHSPDLARARALAGLCALQADQRAEAAQLAAQAQTAFEQQADVSAYFKQPLAALQQRLGSKSGMQSGIQPSWSERSR